MPIQMTLSIGRALNGAMLAVTSAKHSQEELMIVIQQAVNVKLKKCVEAALQSLPVAAVIFRLLQGLSCHQ